MFVRAAPGFPTETTTLLRTRNMRRGGGGGGGAMTYAVFNVFAMPFAPSELYGVHACGRQTWVSRSAGAATRASQPLPSSLPLATAPLPPRPCPLRRLLLFHPLPLLPLHQSPLADQPTHPPTLSSPLPPPSTWHAPA